VKPKPQALGKPLVCGVEAQVGAKPATTQALLTISSEHSRADRPESISREGARPPVALRGKPRGRAPVILVEIPQETLLDGILVPTRKSFTGFHLGSSPQAHHLSMTGSRRS
jgi:hypothetical protein